ncbi:hypothetical protein BXZ70DRAFT_229509 [Cristinia sonorae]|uniref:Uncharacterized protein n=1 Tax=Cristinia sonorae TaxID=1940300 RepID=A0A8K0UM87_9AGAR|nr:hypothetical protein BXZ70DRAFT_229509 [Cristinia sonorae]
MANHISDELSHHFRWGIPERTCPQIARVFGIPEGNHLGSAPSATLRRISNILKATGALSIERFKLSNILEDLAESVDADDRPGTYSHCTTFLQVYWQLYYFVLEDTKDWTRTVARKFYHDRNRLLRPLKEMWPGIASESDSWIIQHMHLTLEHFRKREFVPHWRKVVRVEFPSKRLASIPAASRLRTSSLMSLAQVSYMDVCAYEDCIRSLKQIEEYHNQDSEMASASYYSLLASAMLLGFKMDTIGIINHSTGTGWTEAVRHIIVESERYLQWEPHEDEDCPQLARLMGIWHKDDRFGSEKLEVVTRIFAIVRSGAAHRDAESTSWTTPSSHIDWVTEYVPRVCRELDTNSGVVFYCIASAILSISYISDLSSRAHDKTLHTALNAVSRLKPPLENESPASFAFIQMQHAALSLLCLFVQTGLFRSSDIPTFSPGRCDWDLSHLRGSEALSNMSTEGLDLIEERDRFFMKIIQATAGDADGAPIRRAWLDDPQNDQLVRQWVHMLHRWMIPHQEDILERAYTLPINSLFGCERFRRPDMSHWGEDLIHVQQVLVAVLGYSWFDRLHDATHGKADFSELIDSTLFVLKMETEHAVAVAWYIQDTIEDFRKYFPRIQERYGFLDPSLRQVQAAYKAKLVEIRNSTVLDVMEDSIWMFDLDGGMPS